MTLSSEHKEQLQKSTVLFVDDSASTRDYFAAVLTGSCQFLTAPDLRSARKILASTAVDILITDYEMPDGHGGELILFVTQFYPQIVRILVSAHLNEQRLLDIVNTGGVLRVLKKPCPPESIEEVIVAALRKLENNQLIANLRHSSLHDHLTDVFNRRHFDAELSQAMAEAERHQHQVGLVFVDLDDFKKINDQYGHLAGDTVLVEFARSLKMATRKHEKCFRLGGDEFAILVRISNPSQLIRMAQRISAHLNNIQVPINGQWLPISASLGLASLSANAGTPEQLHAQADYALYLAKKKGKNRWAIFGKP